MSSFWLTGIPKLKEKKTEYHKQLKVLEGEKTKIDYNKHFMDNV
jgi:hypothetical protein